MSNIVEVWRLPEDDSFEYVVVGNYDDWFDTIDIFLKLDFFSPNGQRVNTGDFCVPETHAYKYLTDKSRRNYLYDRLEVSANDIKSIGLPDGKRRINIDAILFASEFEEVRTFLISDDYEANKNIGVFKKVSDMLAGEIEFAEGESFDGFRLFGKYSIVAIYDGKHYFEVMEVEECPR